MLDPRGEVNELRKQLEVLHANAARIEQRLLRLEREFHEKSQEETAKPLAEHRTVAPPVLNAPQSPTQRPVPTTGVQRMRQMSAPVLKRPLTPPPRRKPAKPNPLVQFFKGYFDQLSERTREVGVEIMLTTYWLPRLAILCIAVAVVFFMVLAGQRWGNNPLLPHFRVACGYAVCAALLVAGWRTEKRYAPFAKVLYAGGFAVGYFVTFATHYIPFARIFDSPAPTLMLLSLFVAAWAAVAELRRSRTIATMVTLLGHLTVLIATLSADDTSRFSMAGIVVLTAGSAYFLLRRGWYYVALLGILGSYFNHAVHFAKYPPATDGQFAMSISALTAYLLIFAVSEFLLNPEKRLNTSNWLRNGFVTSNTVCYFTLAWLIVWNYPPTRPHQHVFLFAYFGVLLGLSMAYKFFREGDALCNTYFVKSIGSLTLGLGKLYSGDTLTTWLAVETVVLLAASRTSRLVVSRLLAFGVAVLAVTHGLIIGRSFGYEASGYWPAVLKAGMGIGAFLFACQLYERTNWRLRSPKFLPLSTPTLRTLWRLELIGEAPDDTCGDEKTLNGLLFPVCYAVGALLLFLAFNHRLIHDDHRFLGIALFSMVIVVAAWTFRSKPFGLLSLAAFVLALFPYGPLHFLRSKLPELSISITALCALGMVTLTSEKRYIGEPEGLAFQQKKASPYMLYLGWAFLLALLLFAHYPDFTTCWALMLTAVAAAALYRLLHPNAWSGIAMAAFILAGVLCLPRLFDARPDTDLGHWPATSAALLAAALSVERWFARDKANSSLPVYRIFLCVLGWVCAHALVKTEVMPPWRATAMVGVGVAFMTYAGIFRNPAAAVLSIVGVLFGACYQIVYTNNLNTWHIGVPVGFALLATYWIACERGGQRLLAHFLKSHKTQVKMPGDQIQVEHLLNIGVVLATGLLLVLIYYTPRLTGQNQTFVTIGWFALAVSIILCSLPIKAPFYRHTGLAVIFLSLARVFLVDLKEQDAMFKVIVLAVLGAGILPISYGYFRWMARSAKKD